MSVKFDYYHVTYVNTVIIIRIEILKYFILINFNESLKKKSL